MRNLCRFCHYHHGTPHERSVKIVGSFLIVAMLAAMSASFTNAVYAQQEGAIMAPPAGEPPSMPFPKPPGPPGDEGRRSSNHEIDPRKAPFPPGDIGRGDFRGPGGTEGSRGPEGFPPERKIMPGGERSISDEPTIRPREGAAGPGGPQPFDMRRRDGETSTSTQLPPGFEGKCTDLESCRKFCKNNNNADEACKNNEALSGQPSPRAEERRMGQRGEERRESGMERREERREGSSGSGEMGPSPESTGEEEGQMEGDQRDFVDPNEIKQVMRQFADMKRELNRFAKTKGLGQTDKDAIAAILKKVTDFEAALKKEASRDTLQEFYEAQVWEEIQGLRGRIELPKELKMIERELAKTKKLTAVKTFQKSFLVLKFDMEIVKGHLAEVEKGLAEAKAAYDAGNYQDAFEALQPIHEGMHPGSIQGIMHRLREAGNQIGRIRDAKVRELFVELLEPIVESAKDGDYNGAHQIMNEIEPELRRFMNQALKVRAKDIGSFQTKLDALEELIGKKVEARSESSEGSSERSQ